MCFALGITELGPSRVSIPFERFIYLPIATVGELETKLNDAGVKTKFHHYLARHAFANETAGGRGQGRIEGTQFDPVWSQLAWDRTLTFLGRVLGVK